MENTSTTDLLKSLESIYVDGRYDEALGLLLKNKDAFSRDEFHYNYGTILLKKNELGAGRYNLEMAAKYGANNSSVKNNLEYVKSIVSPDDFQKSPLEKYIETSLGFSVDSVISITLVLLVFSGLLTKLKIFKSKITGLVISLLFITLCITQVLVKSSYRYAIVLKSQKIFEGPSKIYDQVGEVSEGIKIVMGKESGDWVFVESPSTYTGWIKKDKLGRL